MTTDLLRREQAPILDEAWKLIDQEASRVLKLQLAGRKLVDFRGPEGWELAAVNTGRLGAASGAASKGVRVAVREVHPVLELHAPMRLPLRELETVGYGATNPDLRPVTRAAEEVARAEDGVIFNGLDEPSIQGIIGASPHPHLRLSSAADWPKVILAALDVLRQAGVGGPYAVALGSRAYEDVFAARPEGYPIAKQLQSQILDEGAIVQAPAIDAGVVLSTRGGDFELTVGHDLAVGYARTEGEDVDLYLCESFAFRVLEPAAAVVIDVK